MHIRKQQLPMKLSTLVNKTGNYTGYYP